MKLVFVVLVVVVVLGLAVYGVGALTGKKDAMMPEQTAQNEMKKKEDAMMESGTARYILHSPTALSDAASDRRILFFYANWCPTCKPADTSFSENSTRIPEGVRVVRVNYNDNETDAAEKELANTYAVTYQHTFVEIDGSGAEVTRWSGGGIDELLAHL